MTAEIVIHPENRNPILPLAAAGGFLLIRYAISAQSAMASSGGTGGVNTDVKSGIEEATATVKALSPLALVCLSVALIPWASMLTLRFINMVLSRV